VTNPHVSANPPGVRRPRQHHKWQKREKIGRGDWRYLPGNCRAFLRASALALLWGLVSIDSKRQADPKIRVPTRSVGSQQPDFVMINRTLLRDQCSAAFSPGGARRNDIPIGASLGTALNRHQTEIVRNGAISGELQDVVLRLPQE
jgi:hypothetical protein